MEAYVQHLKDAGKAGAAARVETCMLALMPQFGDLLPEDVTPMQSEAYARDRFAHGRKPSTVHTELGYLRSGLMHGKRKRWIAEVPYIPLPHKSPPRDRWLSRDEARALIEACVMPHVKLFVVLALSTAGRPGAILDLTWSRVNLDLRILDLRDHDQRATPKGRAVVPINDMAYEALQEARMGAVSPFVIEWGGEKVGSIKKGVKAAVSRAGIEPCTPNTLRHTAAVWMAQSGVPMEKIAEYMGHSDSRTTQKHYARYSPAFLRDAAQALNL